MGSQDTSKSAQNNYSKYPAVIKTPVKFSANNARPGSAAVAKHTTV